MIFHHGKEEKEEYRDVFWKIAVLKISENSMQKSLVVGVLLVK